MELKKPTVNCKLYFSFLVTLKFYSILCVISHLKNFPKLFKTNKFKSPANSI